MHSLKNYLSSSRSIGQTAGDLDGLLLRYGTKPKIIVPGEKALALPREPDGLNGALSSGSAFSELPREFVTQGRLALIYEPTFVLPMIDPTADELLGMGVRAGDMRNENPRAICTGTVTQVNTGETFYGAARIVALENGVRMGKTLLLSVDDSWSRDREKAEERLLSLVQQANETVYIGPEGSDKKWRTLLALLGGSSDPAKLPPNWQRRMRLVAGLYQVNMDIRPNPENARTTIIAELKSRPPEGLLVWADWVAHPDPFLQAYTKARPGAYAELLGNSERSMDFDDHVSELQLHLRQLVSGEAPVKIGESETNWTYAKESILALVGPHFELTARAVAMLENNPYPKPDRMLNHMRKLEQLARHFHEASGSMGRRITDVAIERYGIEIALFDSALEEKTIEFSGKTLNPQPHVKVDDYKRPDSVGRIYFAIDQSTKSFVIDHIGLHDYV